eukprot:5508616-Amphidinium_carterae.1
MKLVLDELLRSGFWSDSQAAALAGRLNYMRTFIAGRPLHAVIQMVYARAARPGKDQITQVERSCLTLIREYLDGAKPRLVSFAAGTAPLVLYTDGAVEQGIATAGAVLHIPGKPHQWFQLEVPDSVHQSWTDSGTKHAVMQAELYPVIVSRLTWQK